MLPVGTWNIDIDTFVEIMSQKENAKLLTSGGIRRFVLEKGGFGRRKGKAANIY